MTGQPGESKTIRSTLDLLLLTWAAGVLDALSYLRAKVFTANMTGNTILLGLGAVGPGRSRLPECAMAIGGFVLGALVAALVLVPLRHLDERQDLKLGTLMEIPFAVAFTVLWAAFRGGGPSWVVPAMILTSACSLGIQSVAVRRLRISGVVTTFITGTITTGIISLCQRRETGGQPGTERQSSPLLLGGMFLVYVLAAAAGGVLGSAQSPFAGMASLAALLIVVVRSFFGGRRPVPIRA